MPVLETNSSSVAHADALVLSVLSHVPAGPARREVYNKLKLEGKLGRRGQLIAEQLLAEDAEQVAIATR